MIHRIGLQTEIDLHAVPERWKCWLREVPPRRGIRDETSDVMAPYMGTIGGCR